MPQSEDAAWKHVKLCGGTWKTAAHDMQRIKDARKAVADANKVESDRAALRRNRAAGYDIEWAA